MSDTAEAKPAEENFENHVGELPYAYGGYLSAGVLKQTADDFIVDEQLSFQPTGEGEHAYLYIQKRNLNTEDVAKRLVKHANVTRKSVSFAGMKDRQGVTQQWFSVHLPGLADPDWSLLNCDELQVQTQTRHLRKLKRGAIKSNHFEVTVRDINASEALIEARIAKISIAGIPNYFMGQRFGYKANNLNTAQRIFTKNHKIKDRNKKGLLLSAVRAYLFNKVLALRLNKGCWNTALQGDAFVLDGTRNFFSDEALSTQIDERLKSMDLHPSGVLFGVGDTAVKADALAIESMVEQQNPLFIDGLIKEKVAISRRALRARVSELSIEFLDESCAKFSFNLPSGSYATAVMRELFDIK